MFVDDEQRGLKNKLMAKKIRITKPPPERIVQSILSPSGFQQSAEYKRFIKTLNESIVQGRTGAEFFRIFIECTWALLKGDSEYFKKTLDVYTFDEGQVIGNAFNAYIDCADKFIYEDILGAAFMETDAKSVRAGQFFTPAPLAEVMARNIFNPADFDKDEKVTVHDPCVGSGVMLLSYAKVVNQELGPLALTKIELSGQDIDRRCVLMTKIQLRLYGLDLLGRLIRLSGPLTPKKEKKSRGKRRIKKKLKIRKTKKRSGK